MRKDKKVTPKEKLFLFELMSDSKMNPEKAALKVGYTKSVARTKAYLWVSNSKQNPKPHLKAFLDKLLEKKEQKLDITTERVRNEIAKLAFSNVVDIIEKMGGQINLQMLNKLDESERAAIMELSEVEAEGVVTRKIKLHSKSKALDMLCRMLRIYDKKDLIKKYTIIKIYRDGKVEREKKFES